MKQRVAARLLLASCTLALALGVGTAVAVTGVLSLQHPSLTVRAPGEAVGHLDRGPHQLFVLRQPGDAGGEASLAESRPLCTVSNLRTGRVAPAAPTDAGFAAVRIERGGRHRVGCRSSIAVTVDIAHEGERATAWLAAIGRGLAPAVLLTVLAALLAGRALVTARRLQSSPPAPEATPSPPAPEATPSPPAPEANPSPPAPEANASPPALEAKPTPP